MTTLNDTQIVDSLTAFFRPEDPDYPVNGGDLVEYLGQLLAARAPSNREGVAVAAADLPDIDPVETLAEVIAIATTGLHALATEHEGNLRDAATRLHEKTTALLDLVTRW
jgi:hypothetical protein